MSDLDRHFDNADKKVVYDLNFAILETSCAFSSGNLMPVRAKELGIAILGENSGGGGCALLIDFMSCGYFMNISGMPKFRAENPDTDVDLVFPPQVKNNVVRQIYGNGERVVSRFVTFGRVYVRGNVFISLKSEHFTALALDFYLNRAAVA